jgi:hypothetical protein
MKRLVLALLLSSLAVTGAVAESWKDTATTKKLAGAALTSFMKKCEKDATMACDTQAADKKLCVKDATGAW